MSSLRHLKIQVYIERSSSCETKLIQKNEPLKWISISGSKMNINLCTTSAPIRPQRRINFLPGSLKCFFIWKNITKTLIQTTCKLRGFRDNSAVHMNHQGHDIKRYTNYLIVNIIYLHWLKMMKICASYWYKWNQNTGTFTPKAVKDAKLQNSSKRNTKIFISLLSLIPWTIWMFFLAPQYIPIGCWVI